MSIPHEVVGKFKYNDIPHLEDTGAFVEPERFLAIDQSAPHEVDDALSIREDNGSFIVKVAIAECCDVDLLDEDELAVALDRKKSTYISYGTTKDPGFKNGVMLPEWYLAGRSLTDQQPNPAIISTISYTPGEEPHLESIRRGFINVVRRTYRDYSNQLIKEDPDADKTSAAKFVRMTLEAEGVDGLTPKNAKDYRDVFAEILVSKAMVMTNTAVPEWASQLSVPFVRRASTLDTQANPDKNDQLGLDPSEKLYRSLFINRPDKGRAFYTPYDERHEIMDKQVYAHTSSPLRRLSDLIFQLQLVDVLHDEEPRFDQMDIELLADHCNKQ